MKKNVALFILAVILLINSVPALSVVADEIEKVKTLNVRIAKEYHEHGKFTAEDFPELELESLYIMSDSKYEIADVYYREICYYFVLKTAITIEEMKNFAKNNPYVEEAYIGYTEPFEGTIKLNVPEGKKIEIEVGESLDLKFLGAKGYTKPFSFSYVVVCLDKYDDNREYEPKDFPEVALSKIKHKGNGRFELYLQEPGFWNAIKAVDALSVEGNYYSVDLESFAHPSVFEINWSVADRDVVALGDRENNSDKCSGDVAKLTALKEGITTLEVSYYNEGEEVDCVYEIEVVPRKNENNVNAGDDNDILCILFMSGIAGSLFIIAFVLIKKKSLY
ncbi:MAG: hypothetical protein IKJ59_11410 [Clostridia bacterium]|nr:hypothetical protein [Clostridia bacterium]